MLNVLEIYEKPELLQCSKSETYLACVAETQASQYVPQ